MAVFAIGDLHLSLGTDKPMDVFRGWENHMERLESSWRALVTPEDTVVVAGDISWAMRLEDAYADFAFLDGLPGSKILLKGNHDFWWSTRKKVDDWKEKNGFHTIRFLFGDSYVVEGLGICGSRGWLCGEEDDRVYARELGRLARSVASLEQQPHEETAVFLHYPPIYRDYCGEEFLALIQKAGASRCFYGHLHGSSIPYAFGGVCRGIKFKLISADNLGFVPLKIK